MKLEFPKVIAHRGASADAPENTMTAFEQAVALGVRALEFDVCLSADQVPVVIHDATLDRTTNGAGPVCVKSGAELQALDAGSWFGDAFIGAQIPTLAEVLAFADQNHLYLNVEVKPLKGGEETCVSAVLEVLEGVQTPVLVSSFSDEVLELFHQYASQIPRAYLTDAIPSNWRARLEYLGCEALHCWDPQITADEIRHITAAGFELRVFTVNTLARATELFQWGASGVFTNCPDKLIGQV